MTAAFVVGHDGRAQLDQAGYTLLPGAVPPDLLDRLRRMADRVEHDQLRIHRAGGPTPHSAIIPSANGPVLERTDKLIELDAEIVLDLLASPSMIAVARDLCGRGAVPIEVDLLFKRPHPHGYVIWHQGAQHARRAPYLNVGIHLDDAAAGDGCLRYVPGTHTARQDIGRMSGQHGWDIPGSVDVPTRAGDVLVQDMMVLHCSPPKRSPGCRRTIYVEVRPASSIVEERSQSPQWAELRRRLMALVVARAAPGSWPAAWSGDLPAVGETEAEVAAIAALPEPPIPSYYCDRPVDHPDYPIPADLRPPVTGSAGA